MKQRLGHLAQAVGCIALIGGCNPEPIGPNQEQFTLTSAHTNTDYAIYVAYPDGYQEDQAYHTVYLLDGDDYSREAAALLETHTDVVMVGIGYAGQNERGRDYAYPADPTFPNQSGGAREFARFLNEELIPHVETTLRVRPTDRALFGHSLGGYFSLYMLYQQEQPNPFQYHMAASPNLMWHDYYLLELEAAFAESDPSPIQSLYISMGDLEGVALNLSFDAFRSHLAGRQYANRTIWERLENTSHRNSPIASLQSALETLY